MGAYSQLSAKVLIADDYILAAEALGMVLRSTGCQVTVARDGMHALTHVSEYAPDIVVTDMSMPRRGGVGLIWQLRRERPDLPILVFTEHAPQEGANVLEAGGAENVMVLDKSVGVDLLVGAIEAVLAECSKKLYRSFREEGP